MTLNTARHRPLRLGRARKHDVRSQFGALPWRFSETGLEVLLVTGRKSGRWTIPKGWPKDRATPAEAAAHEAWEEAGARGTVTDVCIGIYSNVRKVPKALELPCVVAVFPLEVKELADRWPEAGARKRRWFSPDEAARLVVSPELRRVLLEFDPAVLPQADPVDR